MYPMLELNSPISRSSLETQKLELLSEISGLKLRQTSTEKENSELRFISLTLYYTAYYKKLWFLFVRTCDHNLWTHQFVSNIGEGTWYYNGNILISYFIILFNYKARDNTNKKNHNLLCSLDPPSQSWLFWLVCPL